jgi:histidinol-phosphate aminotransferase
MLLDVYYQMKASALMSAIDEYTKAIFLCSPNNPTGNSMCRKEIESLLNRFDGLVIVDEAYIDFSSSESLLKDLDKYPNLIVLQTFSKAWGCAAIRLGMAFASPEIIAIFNKIKYPYNVNRLTQEEAIKILKQPEQIKAWVNTLLEERARVMEEFAKLPCCIRVFPTDANFFLAKVYEATQIYDYLVSEGIIVRNRTNVALCSDCLRITIGTKEENDALLEALSKIEVE